MSNRFELKQWSAFAAGLETTSDWRAWLADPRLPQGGDAKPALLEMPAMQRRRVERLGRLALQVAYWCQGTGHDGIPLVFASRHGDLARTYAMLQDLARGNTLSPTGFGLSTHNAIAAQYSIARGLPDNYLAVSAGACTAEAAMVEALGLLGDGSSEVLVVNYDSPLPADYECFADEPEGEFAWAWRVGAARHDSAGSQVFSLASMEARKTPVRHLPHSLDVLRFALSDDAQLEFSSAGQGWRWRRHA